MEPLFGDGGLLEAQLLLVAGMGVTAAGVCVLFSSIIGPREFDTPYNTTGDYFRFKWGVANHVDVRDVLNDDMDLVKQYPVLENYLSSE